MKKIIITPSGSEVVDLTAEEITADETKVAENLVKEQELETARQAKIDLKASAKAKRKNPKLRKVKGKAKK